MQPYIAMDERLSDMDFDVHVADEPEEDSDDDDSSDDEQETYRPSLDNFVDRPSTYKIHPFVDIWKDAPVPWYASSTKEPGGKLSSARQPYVKDVDEFL
jgi:hypothetical protein